MTDEVIEHGFTPTIIKCLEAEFGDAASDIFRLSPLLGYINRKTRSAERGSKSRGAFANLYAIYVLVEDYLARGFQASGGYSSYEGAKYTALFTRQRELPFGSKLQNHALNHRLNEEFRRFYPDALQPIVRDPETNRYWFNEKLLMVKIEDRTVNIASVLIDVIDAYVRAKTSAFEEFIADCDRLRDIPAEDGHDVREFVFGLLRPNVDARLFEIASFAILKSVYGRKAIYWGWTTDDLEREPLLLFKTGRTNANDGGIDFVMKPLGRFFQVTEDLNVTKYFLDIDKVHRYPITFVVKSEADATDIRAVVEAQARQQFDVDHVVKRYMDAVEEIINLPELRSRFAEAYDAGKAGEIMDELVLQSRVEFNQPAPDVDAPDDGTGD